MRKIYEIANDIQSEWGKVHPFAKPYLNAMKDLRNIEDMYIMDSAREIVLKFLSNAQQFKGEQARNLKKELKELL